MEVFTPPGRRFSRSLPVITDSLSDSLNDRLLFAVPKKGRLNQACLDLLSGSDIQFHRHNRLDLALVSRLTTPEDDDNHGLHITDSSLVSALQLGVGFVERYANGHLI